MDRHRDSCQAVLYPGRDCDCVVPDPPDDNEVYPLYAALAFEAMVTDDTEAAGHWLRKIPRAVRGKIKIACDDLDMMLSRMGNTHE